jgi:hypothetical protein
MIHAAPHATPRRVAACAATLSPPAPPPAPPPPRFTSDAVPPACRSCAHFLSGTARCGRVLQALAPNGVGQFAQASLVRGTVWCAYVRAQ